MRRVAVTGAGVVSPVGNSPSEFFANLMEGRSGVRRNTSAFSEDLFVKIAAEAHFDKEAHFQKKELGLLDRVSQMAVIASRQAWEDAGAALSDEEKLNAGVSVGTAMGGACSLESTYVQLYRENASRVKPFTVLMAMSNAPASHISMEFGLKGPCLSYTVACSSSSVAIGEAFMAIRHGRADVMVAGGAEALLTYGVIKAWESLGILAPEDKDDPAASCKPFARNRGGLVLGEGAVMFVIEELDRAKRRGARIYAEITGYATTADTFHITKPSVEGQARAMELALESASLTHNDIDYINAHGTATGLNDLVETQAIKKVFGERAYKVPVSSTKSMHGHMMGATGAAEFLAMVLAVHDQALPPTANLVEKDQACDLDYVPLKGRSDARVRSAMSNSFAFGGTNAILIAKGV